MLRSSGLRFPSKLHCSKVATLLASSLPSKEPIPNSIIMLRGTPTSNFNNTDTEVPSRQESNFYYLTGCDEVDFYFIYDLNAHQSYLIAIDADPIKTVWKGPLPSDKDLLKMYEVDFIVRTSKLSDLLYELNPAHILGWNHPELGHKSRELEHFIRQRLVPPAPPKKQDVSFQPHGCLESKSRGNEAEESHHRHHNPWHQGLSFYEAVTLARVHKTPIEMALCRTSTRITSDAHRLVMSSTKVGMLEYQVEALFRYECARQGGRNQSYLPIVGTGVNGAFLHYTRNDTRIKDGDLVLIDAACEVDCYGSDVTRTFPVSGKFSEVQRQIYEIVYEMQTTVISTMKEGVDWVDMAVLSQNIGLAGLKRLGILVGDQCELEASKIIKTFYPHGLGHLLGLDVHENGLGLSASRPSSVVALDNTDPSSGGTLAPPSTRRRKISGEKNQGQYFVPATALERGMLLTVEPGIYFCPANIGLALNNPELSKYIDRKVLAKYMKLGGVRIEDVVFIETRHGRVENITSAPKKLEEVERIVQEGIEKRKADLVHGGEVIKPTIADDATPSRLDSTGHQQEAKKKRGMFKSLWRALRRMF